MTNEDLAAALSLVTLGQRAKRKSKGGFSKAPTFEQQKPKKKRKKNPSRRIKP